MANTSSVPVIHRSRNFDNQEDDAPSKHLGREASAEILMSAIGKDGQDDTVRRALELALTVLESKSDSSGRPGSKEPDDEGAPSSSAKTTIGAVVDVASALPPAIVRRAVLTLAAAFALVQPLASSIADNYFSPTTQLSAKLDEVLVNQSEEQAKNVKRDRNMALISAYLINSEKARQQGLPPPPVPPMMTLMAVQAEVERTSGQ